MKRNTIKILENLIAPFLAVLSVFVFLQLFPINENARKGVSILCIIACGTFFIYKERSALLRKMDLTISSGTKKIIIGVVLAIVCWFFIGLSFNLIFDNPAIENDMTPWGFTYMLISDPGTILDSFKNNNILSIYFPFLCIISIVGFILFCGVMISVFSNIIQRRVDDYINGAIRYKHLKNHIVIIGFDEIMPSLVKQKCQDQQSKDCNILILSKKNSVDVREQVTSMLSKEEEKRIIVYCGRRDSVEELRNLNLHEAKEVYILGNRQNIGHDALNIDCLRKMKLVFDEEKEIVQGKKEKKPCKEKDEVDKKEVELDPKEEKKLVPVTVMFDNYATFSAFQVSDLSKEWRKSFIFRPFNFYEYWAQKVIIDRNFDGIDKNENFGYPRIEGNTPLRGTDDTAHVVIFGITSMGVAIATQAALYLHFSKKKNGELRKSRISFICNEAKKEMHMFYSLYNSFFEIQSSYYRDFIGGDGSEEPIDPTYFEGESANFLDIEFEFINGKSYHPGVRDYLKSLLKDKSKRLSVFISTGNDRKDINIAMSLPDEIYSLKNGRLVPIYVHQKASGELLHLLQDTSNSKFKNIYPFGMIDTKLDLCQNADSQIGGMLINTYYEGVPPIIDEEKIKERWDKKTKSSDQWSSIYSANSIDLKLKELVSNIEHDWGYIEELLKKKEIITELCEIEQNRWNVEKLLMGYRKPHEKEQQKIDKAREENGNEIYKTFKERMIHDYIRPYNELSSIKWIGMKEDERVNEINVKLLQSIPHIKKYIFKKKNEENLQSKTH